MVRWKSNLYIFLSDAPRVELALGKSISPGSIYEGGDVYFDCLVDASPKPNKILWFQDVSNEKHSFKSKTKCYGKIFYEIMNGNRMKFDFLKDDFC